MKFNLLNRRTHLYLALFLLPWTLVYGISSLPFNHNESFNRFFDGGAPMWTTLFDRAYSRPVPAGQEELRQFGAEVLKETGLDGSYGVYRQGDDRLNIYLYTFRNSTRLTYFVKEGRLLAEKRRFRWDQFLTGMHARGGFEQESFMNDAWAVLIDIVCLGLLIWVASGLVMWWQIRRLRLWGAVALGAGVVTFALFLAGM